MSKWVPLLIATCFWVLSYTRPFSYQSNGLSQSVWTVYSTNGHIGWGRVALSGPDPEKEFGTTALASLQAYIDKSTSNFLYYNSNTKGSTHEVGGELNWISYYSAKLGWLLVAASCLAAALKWRKKPAAKTSAPPDQAA